ncbi:MAG: hypothetical protein F4139_10925 [Gemmatimonadetes bacterium]|nr:hypothetical protein [Gemmatimonadota bacterium]MYA63972.1 hypothetical protein [Gemmatimonadota bacterium]MYB97562.1 hypothetical protein [Gemmatimonadota bacterium]MYH53433.1 hypothetical protein [Gemmatimonadota bacterium]MYI45551.1 hypothetical protein [Gemmatimonadota bacterium]
MDPDDPVAQAWVAYTYGGDPQPLIDLGILPANERETPTHSRPTRILRMSTPDVHSLDPISLRKVWPHEAHDFTPWLAKHIDRLGATLNLRLEQVEREVHLPGAGRVDLTAKQAETGARVVIENQLELSDDSHCLGLLGYAANTEASILIWIAQDFTSYHKSILEWLNAADTIDVYAVAVRAYRVRDDIFVADFRTVVEPTSASSRTTKRTTSTLYAGFYGPLVDRLRREGIRPVGRGGYRGQYRSFQTGHSNAIYSTGFPDGRPTVYLELKEEASYTALVRHKEGLDLAENTVWREDKPWIELERDSSFDLYGSEEDADAVRQWLGDNILRFREVFQPLLDQILLVENGQ